MTNTNRPIRRALVSVFHKEGIEVLAEAFVKAGTEVVSTGSTAKKLAELGVKVIEKIDIGGPSMVRGAAKNNATVAIVTDPADYALVAARVANGEGFSLEERRWLAGKAFAHTAAYDATINEWTAKHWPKPASLDAVEVDKDDQGTEVDSAKFPAQFTRTWDRAHTLRYGENSHQQAALYIDPLNQTGFAHATTWTRTPPGAPYGIWLPPLPWP